MLSKFSCLQGVGKTKIIRLQAFV